MSNVRERITLARNRLAQVRGHAQQAMIFRRLFDPASLAADVFRFPFDRYVRVGRASAPTTISLVIHSGCNLECVMCHSEDVVGSRRPHLSLAQLGTLIRNLGPGRRPNVFLTGGEPFMRKDIMEVFALLKAEGLRCGVVTNGTLLFPERIARLVELEVEGVVLSVHGPEAVHDRITRQPGSFDKLSGAARRLMATRHRTRVLLNCAIQEENADCLDEVVAAGEAMGVDAVRFEHLNFVTPREVEAQSAVWQRLGDDSARINSFTREPERAEALARAVERVRARRWRVPVTFKPSLDAHERDEWYSGSGVQRRHCTYPWRGLFVDAGGEVYPCLFMFYEVGSLLEEPLAEIWNGERMVRFRREIAAGLFPGCSRCCKL